jgi:hypothetical protein
MWERTAEPSPRTPRDGATLARRSYGVMVSDAASCQTVPLFRDVVARIGVGFEPQDWDSFRSVNRVLSKHAQTDWS